MSFPTTGVLSSFTGADENPLSESGVWTSPAQSGNTALKRVSNAAAWSAGVDASDYWNPSTFGPDTEVFVTVPTLPGAGHSVQVWARILNPGNASTMTCYTFIYIPGTGFQYYKVTAGGTFVQQGSTDTSHTLLAGEKIGFAVTGTGTVTLQGYWATSAGVWTALASPPTDASSPINSAGNIALSITVDASTRADDFGGGTISAGAVAHYALPLMGAGRI